MKGAIVLSSSSKKSPKNKKKSHKPIGKIKDVTVTIPGLFDNKGWKEFKKINS